MSEKLKVELHSKLFFLIVLVRIQLTVTFGFRNLSLKLAEEISKPLKNLVDTQNKARKPVSTAGKIKNSEVKQNQI